MSMGGYVEFLTMALLSHKDMFTNMLKIQHNHPLTFHF